ncbi:primosomal protein I [Obesumbacterium proteus ATCC 12841]|uniref:Primosomal protein I n=2 Tax=Obesumbacterium proteus TaxID=82983 RepID=A0AA91ECH4_9GAMM|nr:primosomal protein I [Obesumbacterium proteus ATCC 12841]
MGVVRKVDFNAKVLIPDKSGGRMADLSNGYTKVANEIQQLKPRLRMSGREWQCFEAVIWLTYGWNKKQDRVTNTVIAELTGLSDTHVSDAIRALAERKIIFSQKQGMMKLVGVNTELSGWILDKPETGRKFPKTGKSFPESGKRFPKTVDTQYKNKNSNKNPSSDDSLESPDKPISKFLSSHPDAFVYSATGSKWGTEEDDRASRWIYEKVCVVDASAKEPNWADWANVVRLMRQQDNRTHKEICELFLWANRDSFWCSNILSPAALRKKWGTLSAQMGKPNRSQRPSADPVPHWNSKESWEDFI